MSLISQLPFTSTLINFFSETESCKTQLPIGRCFLPLYSPLIGHSSLFPHRIKIVSRKGSGLYGLRSEKQLEVASCFCVAPPPQRPLARSTTPWLAENDSDRTTRHGWVTRQLHLKHVESSSDSLLSGATCVQVESLQGSSELRIRITCVTQRCYTPAAAAVDVVVLDLLPSSASAAFEVTADPPQTHCWVNVQPFLISWVTEVLFCCCRFQTSEQRKTKKQTKKQRNKETNKGCAGPNGSVKWVRWVSRFFVPLFYFTPLLFTLLLYFKYANFTRLPNCY